jgi:hypothetical protein
MSLLTIVRRTTSQSISNTTDTTISWDASTPFVDDVAGVFSSGSPTIVTVPSGYGKVRVSLTANWANSTTGTRRLLLRLNGTVVCGHTKDAINEAGSNTVSVWIAVTPGDTIDARVYQDSGSSMNLSGTGFGGASEMQVEWDN